MAVRLIGDPALGGRVRLQLPGPAHEDTCLLTRKITQSLKRMMDTHEKRPHDYVQEERQKKRRIMAEPETQTGVLPDPPPLEPGEKELQKLLDDESLATFEEKGQAALVELRKAEAEWLMRSDIFFRLTVLSRSQ